MAGYDILFNPRNRYRSQRALGADIGWMPDLPQKDWKMIIKTLEEIREQRGEEVHGFILVATGALPAEHHEAARIAGEIQRIVDLALTRLEGSTGLEVTSLTLRMEKYDVYLEEGLPGAKRG